MGVGKIALFGLAAVSALGIGVGAAEIHKRFFTSPPETSISERAAAAQIALTPTPANPDLVKLYNDMAESMSRDRQAVVREIRSHCAYRHPDSSGVAGACSRGQIGHYETIARIWDSRNTDKRGIVALCMDRNRTLHGFDWQSISWCYERLEVSRRQKT